MKRIKLVLSAVVMLSALAACTNKEEIEGTGHGFDEATFSVEAVSVENTAATFKVSSSGAPGATYYGFLTDDMLSKPEALVKSALSGVNVTRHILSSGTTTPKVEGLRQGGKAYRYIVTGLLANGATYNTPVAAEFVTAGDFTANSVGVISYPNPISEPTTVKFEGFPGKFVYGLSETELSAEQIKEIVNSNLDTEEYASAEIEKTVSFGISEEGTYFVYAYELDDNDEPTLSYKTFTLNVENLDFSSYEAYIGEWYINGNEDSVLKLTEKQKGVSFYVEGIPTAGLPTSLTTYEPAVAEFDLASGQIILKEQDLSTFVISAYGDCMKDLNGVFNAGGTIYGAYPFNAEEPSVLFTGEMDADGNIVTKTGATVIGGNSYPFVGMRYSWYILEGANAGKGNWSSEIVAFPLTLKSKPDEPSEEYQAWIGTWYTESGDKMVIEKDKTNATYSVTGFFGDVPAITRFNPEDGSMSFYGQAIDKDDTYTYYLYGRDQDNYVESGSQDGTSTLAFATLSADKKSISIVGNEYQAVYGSTTYDEIIVALEVFAIDADSKIYSVGDKGVKLSLPATWSDELPTASEAYLSWIGDWEVVRVPEVSHEATEEDVTAGNAAAVGEKVIDTEEEIDIWTIAEKKTNSLYTITGIEGLDWAEVEASFNKADGKLYIDEQTILKNQVLTVELLAEAYNGILYDNYWNKVCVASLNEDGTAVLASQDPGYGAFYYKGKLGGYKISGFHFYGTTGNYITFWNENATPIDAVLTPVKSASKSNAVKSVSDNFRVEHKSVSVPSSIFSTSIPETKTGKNVMRGQREGAFNSMMVKVY